MTNDTLIENNFTGFSRGEGAVVVVLRPLKLNSLRNRVANDTFVWSNNNDLFFGIKRTGESVFLPWRLCVIRVDVAMAMQCTSNNKADSLVQQGQAAPGSQVAI